MRTRLIRSSSNSVPSVHRTSNKLGAEHKAVLLQEAIENLSIQPNDTVVDATLGGAGHAREIASRLGEKGHLIGFDLDADAIERARTVLASSKSAITLIESNFRNLETELRERNVASIDKALFDLGWSSFQLEVGRGFSFLKDEPLLMTYSKDSKALTAKTIINEWEEGSIADVIYGWGEERYSRKIAKAIVGRRVQKPFETASDLAETIKASVPPSYRYGRIHPATKTFQALRIAVNDELGALREGVAGAWKVLKPGGRIAVISFHSIEDREVKHLFADFAKEGGTRITKKPITPTKEELAENPRARSAKLRVIEKYA